VHLQVEVRACSKHAARPIIVDVAGLSPSICVSGYLRFQGTIKFINSAPLPERAGLWPLLSVLSAEGNGVMEFEVGRRKAGDFGLQWTAQRHAAGITVPCMLLAWCEVAGLLVQLYGVQSQPQGITLPTVNGHSSCISHPYASVY
jgi:hypothetical protein